MSATRFALVSGARDTHEVEALLPDNYRVVGETRANGFPVVIIAGEDVAGWRLDEYVIPRLASGLLWSLELREHFT